MKKIFLGIIALSCITACKQEQVIKDSPSADSLAFETDADSLTQAAEELRHPGPDGFFDDFIYLFMQDKSVQLDRIQFPLRCYQHGKELLIQKIDWQHDSIYAGLSENTLVADGNHPEELDTLPNLKKATVELVDLNTLALKQYKFSNIAQQWILVEINEESLKDKADDDFYVFYSRFVNDEEYQIQHVHNPFYFKTFDTDIDEEIKGWVAAEQWPAYRIYMPADTINNIIYDDKVAKSNYRTFIISSPSSGMNCNLIFKRVAGKWQLVRMEN